MSENLAETFGDDDSIYVERGPFEQVPTELWIGGGKADENGKVNHAAVSPRAVVLYLALSRQGGKEARAYPSRTTLAKALGVSARTIDTAIDELIEHGWLLVTPKVRKEGRGQTSNHYTLLWTPITSSDDERLLRHKRGVAEFEAWMAKRNAANEVTGGKSQVRSAAWSPPSQDSATGGVAGFCDGGSQDSATEPSQKTATLDKDFSGNQTSTETSSAAQPALDLPAAATSTASPDGSAKKPSKTSGETTSKRGTRIPADFAVTAEMVEWAREHAPNVDGRVETANFIDYWTAKAGRDAVKLDWVKTWQVWFRRAQERAGRSTTAGLRRGYDDVATWGQRDQTTGTTTTEEEAAAIFGVPLEDLRNTSTTPPATGTHG